MHQFCGYLGGLPVWSRKNPRFQRVEWTTMARRDGFEPATASFEDSCSVQLSYRRTPRIISLSSRSSRMNQSLLSSLFLGDNVEFLGLFLENDDGEKQSVGGSCGFGKVTRPPNAVNAKEIAKYEAKEE